MIFSYYFSIPFFFDYPAVAFLTSQRLKGSVMAGRTITVFTRPDSLLAGQVEETANAALRSWSPAANGGLHLGNHSFSPSRRESEKLSTELVWVIGTRSSLCVGRVIRTSLRPNGCLVGGNGE